MRFSWVWKFIYWNIVNKNSCKWIKSCCNKLKINDMYMPHKIEDSYYYSTLQGRFKKIFLPCCIYTFFNITRWWLNSSYICDAWRLKWTWRSSEYLGQWIFIITFNFIVRMSPWIKPQNQKDFILHVIKFRCFLWNIIINVNFLIFKSR